MAAPKIHAARRLVGRNVKRLRVAKGWSQEDLGAAARLNQVHVSRIERGINNTTVDILQRLAHALAVPVAELLSEAP